MARFVIARNRLGVLLICLGSWIVAFFGIKLVVDRHFDIPQRAADVGTEFDALLICCAGAVMAIIGACLVVLGSSTERRLVQFHSQAASCRAT